GDTPDHVLRISAKTGEGVTDVLDAIVERIPAPEGDPAAPARALIFDSSYDQYRGVVAFVRVVDGGFRQGEAVRAMALGTEFDAASRCYEPERSQALGFGFRCGFLGLLHMEIVRERLEREFDLDLLVTAPNVAYRVLTKAGDEVEVHNPSEMPREVEEVEEPY